MKKVKKTHWYIYIHFVLFTFFYSIYTFNVIRQKRGLVCPLKNVYSMYKYSFLMLLG